MNKGGRNSRWIFGIFLLISIALSIPVSAQEEQKSRMLEEVVVTATRTEEKLVDVPITTEVITREKIEMSGATHLGDLIGNYITGHYHKYNGMLASPGMRGFYTDAHGDDLRGYVLLLVDGHRIGTGNAAKISLERIERVEVIRGPASALYGSAAMGGVINMITKKGDGKLSTTLGGKYGSFDYYKGRVSSGGILNDKFRFYASASYEDVGDYKTPDYGTAYNTGENKKNIGGNFIYSISPNHELRLGGNYAYNKGEAPGWTDGAYSRYDKEADQFYNKSNGYADIEYSGDFFSESLHWRGMGYYIWDRNHWNYGSPAYDATSPRDYQSKYTDETLGTDHQWSWKMAPWNKLLFGFNLEHLEKEGIGVTAGKPSVPYTPNMDYDSQALFIQDSLELWNNRVNIIAAGRYDRYEVSTVKPTLVDLPDFNERNETFDHFSPKGGVGVKFLDELLRLRANIGEGFKSPSADQLSADYVHSTGVHYIGNPDLDPETSLTYDIGFDVFHDFFTFKATYFHTDYSDKIVQTSEEINGQKIASYENHGDAEMAGLEFNIEWFVGHTFSLPFELSFWSNVAVNTNKDDKETGRDLLWISDYEVKSGLSAGYQGFTAQLGHVLVGPQMITNWDTYETEEKGRLDYWDLTMSYKFLDNWKVSTSILNLFDDNVEWIRGYPMAERNYRAGLSFTF